MDVNLCQLPVVPPVCVSGVSLRRQVREATVEVLEGVAQLLEVILNSPLQRYMHTKPQSSSRYRHSKLYSVDVKGSFLRNENTTILEFK